MSGFCTFFVYYLIFLFPERGVEISFAARGGFLVNGILYEIVGLTFSYPPLKILLYEKDDLDHDFPFNHRGTRADG